MRILFLGGTSLTGPFAVRRLHALGHHVTVVHRGQHEAKLSPEVRHIRADFAHLPPETFHPAPDVAIHMWAMTEADAQSFVDKFRGVVSRAVVISSGDVYRAYGRLTGLEPGPPDSIPLAENAPLRESRYPYRKTAPDPGHWLAQYDKILVERVIQREAQLPSTILRFPAIADAHEHRRFQRWLQPMLQTTTRGHGELRIQEGWANWRWTHGFAEDVAEAVVLAAMDSSAAGRVYNVGESHTPTMAERLAEFADAAGWRGRLIEVPADELSEADRMPYDFSHHIVYDTTRIRRELGYAEIIPHRAAIARTLERERENRK